MNVADDLMNSLAFFIRHYHHDVIANTLSRGLFSVFYRTDFKFSELLSKNKAFLAPKFSKRINFTKKPQKQKFLGFFCKIL